jgi:hypothetical protein
MGSRCGLRDQNPETASHTLLDIVMMFTSLIAASPSFRPGTSALPASGSRELLVLARVAPAGAVIPAARSYDGNIWEVTQGGLGQKVAVVCDQQVGTCEATIPPIFDGSTYRLDTYSGPAITPQQEAAKLLTQVTFGPTKETLLTIDATSDTSAREWVHGQMQLPASLHRHYYRRRVNPRSTDHTLATGSIRSACHKGSRWHRFALTKADEGRTILVEQGAASLTLRDETGALRAEVSSFGVPSFSTTPAAYTICYVEERVGGLLQVVQGDGSKCANEEDTSNPAIEISSSDLSMVHLLSVEEARHLLPLEHVHNASLLTTDLSCTPKLQGLDYVYLRDLDGAYFRHDPRLSMLFNTLAAPANGSSLSSGVAIPRVAKTFLNRDSCLLVDSLGADGSSTQYSSASFELNHTMLRHFYTAGGKVVYVVEGLRLEAPYATSPCSGISRWRRHTGACGSDETALGSSTKAALSAAISGSEDVNEHIVDVEARDAVCTGASAIGAKLNVDGDCWEHVHPDTLNVYDFSYWPASHPGGATTISQFAVGGGTVLGYPASHDMDRWKQHKKQLVYLGRWGDRVDFQHLPSTLQLAELAALVGSSSSTPDSIVEACGSPGEVANEPGRNLYNIFLTGKVSPPDGRPADVPTVVYPISADVVGKLHDLNEKRTRGVHKNLKQGKNIVWTMVVTQAPDQLRQRVAWSLYQIFVISDQSMKWNEIETWHVYYDIFVRNAFGNYLDVLREVAYSPMMASYLTFLQNKGIAYGGSYPDENFAREIMQLFSIGLWKLNPDGSQMLDEYGLPIDTYSNDDSEKSSGIRTRASSGSRPPAVDLWLTFAQ